MYALKQAPREWLANLASTYFGFLQSKADYSINTFEEDKSFVDILGSWVYNQVPLIKKSEFLASQFHMYLGVLRYFLGLTLKGPSNAYSNLKTNLSRAQS